MELKGWPAAEDYPIPPSGRKRPDPQRGLLLQAGGLQGAPWPANGRQTRPLLLPLQHGLPGSSGAAGKRLLGKDWELFFSLIIS